MRIAIVVEALPPEGGGGERVAWIHARELGKRHEVAVLTLGASERYETATVDDIAVHRLPRRTRKLLAYATVDRPLLDRCIARFDPDVIHCHMPNVLAACLAKRGRLLVATLHDGVPETERRRLKPGPRYAEARFKLLRRLNLAKADAVTCVSRASLAATRALHPRHAAKLRLIENPIDERFFGPVAREDSGYVLNFGRQIALKSAALLEAARAMPRTRFVFVGAGEMVRDHGLPNVRFVGFSADVERYIDGAAVCAFPSRSENFPLAGLEAMARGKAVVAARRGFGEYIEHGRTGILLDSLEPEAIRAALEPLLADGARRAALGREARLAAERYRPAEIVPRYERLYDDALAARAPALSTAEG